MNTNHITTTSSTSPLLDGPSPDGPSPGEPLPDWTGFILVALAFLGIVFCSVALHTVGWLADQISMIMGASWPWWAWLLISIGHGLLLFILLAPFAWFWRQQPARAIFQTWALAALFVMVLAPARVAPATAVYLANILQIILTLGYIVLLLLLMGWQRRQQADDAGSAQPRSWPWMVLLIVPVLAYPWLTWGALGSPLDALLNLVAGLLFGVAAGLLLSHFLIRPLRRTMPTSGQSTIWGGFIVGAALLIMATGFGFNGMQLLLMLSLPALGWVVMSIDPRPAQAWRPLALLIGLTTAAPLMFIDPAELQLILGGNEIIQWAFYAAALSLLLTFLVGAILLAGRAVGRGRALASAGGRWMLLGGVAVAWLSGGLVYWQGGQPGFHGDRLFVIFVEQADLTTAVTLDDIETRRQFVYEILVNHADRSQADVRQTLDRLNVAYTPYYLMNAMEVEAGPLLRWWLASRPEVDRVLDSPVLRPLPVPIPMTTGEASAPLTPAWNLTQIGADRVWQEFDVTGDGIVVGQSDSGVQWDHPEFVGRYRGQEGDHHYHWFDPWNHSLEPTDMGGHGTHTLGSILGQNTGVAPGATWFGCANLARNLANPALYLDCMQFMLAPFPLGGDPFREGDPRLAADVLNNSWGCPEIEGCDPGSLQAAVYGLRAAGIFVVASAGNEGPACESVSSPIALYAESFSVGAVDSAGHLADFSSRGPVTADGSGRTKPDIVAPGVNILSAYPGSSYSFADGTSMAGPHVVGVVALIWSANPALVGDIEATETILIETAQPYSGPLPDCVISGETPNNGVGYGIVDAYAAVQRALEMGGE